jgi:hypothetical protein
MRPGTRLLDVNEIRTFFSTPTETVVANMRQTGVTPGAKSESRFQTDS